MIDQRSCTPVSKGDDSATRIRKFSIPALPEVASAVRFHAAEMARAMGFGSEQIGDIELAVGEAVSNAIKHGCSFNCRARIIIRLYQHSDRLVAEVSDSGCGFDLEGLPKTLPNDLIEGGRGLRFIRSFMDEVSYSFDGGTTVRMTKLLDATKW